MAMADTKIERNTAASTAAQAAATPRRRAAASSPKAAVSWTAGLSEEVLEAVEVGQRAAIEAVRRFFGTVEEALPEHGEAARQGIVDSALQMADRLVHVNYDFIRKVIDRAGKSL
jgi:hypothetical protein